MKTAMGGDTVLSLVGEWCDKAGVPPADNQLDRLGTLVAWFEAADVRAAAVQVELEKAKAATGSGTEAFDNGWRAGRAELTSAFVRHANGGKDADAACAAGALVYAPGSISKDAGLELLRRAEHAISVDGVDPAEALVLAARRVK